MPNIKSIKYLTHDEQAKRLFGSKCRLRFWSMLVGAVILLTNATLYFCNVYDRDFFALIAIFGVASFFFAAGIDIGMSDNAKH